MKFISTIIGLAFFCVPAHAATLDFSGIKDLGGLDPFYLEKGIIAESSTGSIAYNSSPGTVHLADGFTPFASSISFSGGERFNAIQFDLKGTNKYCGDSPCTDSLPFNNVRVLGKRDGSIVADFSFYSGEVLRTEVLDNSFQNLDELEISMLLPPAAPGISCLLFGPCSFMDLDNLVLVKAEISSVPLPAGLPLYGVGLFALGYILRRRRAKLENNVENCH